MKQEIVMGMAKAFFASAWASLAEETNNDQNFSGNDIMDLMPKECDTGALAAAGRLAKSMEETNHAPLDTLYARAAHKLSAEQFGHYSAMQAMGTGVGLCDYGIDEEMVRVPYQDFSSCDLVEEYFTENIMSDESMDLL